MTMTLEHDTERASAPSIDLRGLRKSFRTSGVTVEAVRGVDVAVASGETVALLGPNGAGKSTTIDICSACSAPTPAPRRCSAARRRRRSPAAASAGCCSRAGCSATSRCANWRR